MQYGRRDTAGLIGGGVAEWCLLMSWRWKVESVFSSEEREKRGMMGISRVEKRLGELVVSCHIAS